MSRTYVLFAALVLALGPRMALPAVFTVNTAEDAPDASPGDGVCATSQGSCTLRAAIQESNALAGIDTIAFSIGAGPCSIVPASALPVVSDPVVIDGATQPGYAGAPLVELNGAAVQGHIDGLTIAAGGSTVRGLVMNRFSGSGLRLSGGGGNTVQGNWIGIDLTGALLAANKDGGLVIDGSPNNLVGGTTAEARNVISGNLGMAGITISGPAASGNVIQGNYIGTDATGLLAVPNQGRGIAIRNAPNNLIGGTAPGARNVISGNRASGVRILGESATGNLVQGNYIGADVTGKAFVPNSRGLQARSNSNTFGGAAPGSGNLVAGNTIDGIVFTAEANNNLVQGNRIVRNGSGVTSYGGTGNAILSNAIAGNSRRGIDLGGDGVTQNDPGDFDAGANNLQNSPVLTSAKTTGFTVIVAGTLDSAASTTMTLQFFANSACDVSGFGEGEKLLGETVVTTDGAGSAAFETALPARIPPGAFVTATATDPAGNTSEFSACVAVTL